MGIGRPGNFLTRSLIIIIPVVGLIAILHAAAGERIITDLYNGHLPFTSIELFEGHPDRPLEYFLGRADIIVWQFLVVGLPLTIVLYVFVYAFFRKLMICQDNAQDLRTFIPESKFKYDSLTALIIYSGLTIIFAYKTLGSFNSALIGPPADNMAFFWNCWWVDEYVLRGAGSLAHSSMIMYPEGANMYYHDWSFYNLFLCTVLRQFLNPFTSNNLVALHSFPFAGIAAFFLVKYITRNSYLALLGGFLFTFCPYHFARVSQHMNLASVQFIPLLVLYVIKTVRENKKRHIAAAALFFLLNTLCSWVYLVFSFMFLLFSYVYLAIRRNKVLMNDVLLKFSIIVGATIIAMSPWLWEMVLIKMRNADVGAAGRSYFVADIVGLVIPGHYHWMADILPLGRIHTLFSGNSTEAATYLGIPAIVLVTVVSIKSLPIVAKYLAGCIIFLLLSLGPELHILGFGIPVALPDSVIALMPFISNVRAPARYIIYFYLFWSITIPIAIAYAVHSARNSAWKWVLIVGLPLVFVVDNAKSISEMTDIVVPVCYEAIAKIDENTAILDIPFDYQSLQYYKYYQTYHGYPTVEGHVSRKVNHTLIDRLDFEDLEVQKRQLEKNRVRFIVLHKDQQGISTIPVNRYAAIYEVIYDDARNTVFQVY
jgi:hypothetical protein